MAKFAAACRLARQGLGFRLRGCQVFWRLRHERRTSIVLLRRRSRRCADDSRIDGEQLLPVRPTASAICRCCCCCCCAAAALPFGELSGGGPNGHGFRAFAPVRISGTAPLLVQPRADRVLPGTGPASSAGTCRAHVGLHLGQVTAPPTPGGEPVAPVVARRPILVVHQALKSSNGARARLGREPPLLGEERRAASSSVARAAARAGPSALARSASRAASAASPRRPGARLGLLRFFALRFVGVQVRLLVLLADPADLRAERGVPRDHRGVAQARGRRQGSPVRSSRGKTASPPRPARDRRRTGNVMRWWRLVARVSASFRSSRW